MKNFLVICKETGQATAFKRVIIEHTEKNNIPVQWFFENEKNYTKLLQEEKIDLVLISPEVLLVEKQIKQDLDNRGIEHLTMKPIDFGLRRMEKLMPELEKYINK